MLCLLLCYLTFVLGKGEKVEGLDILGDWLDVVLHMLMTKYRFSYFKRSWY